MPTVRVSQKLKNKNPSIVFLIAFFLAMARTHLPTSNAGMW
jgi:hypothetical protein